MTVILKKKIPWSKGDFRRVVEDGNGLSDANSYVSIVYADDYFSARGVTSWNTLSDSEKESALIKGTDYINSVFDWNGKKSSKTQALAFPRSNLVDTDGYEVEGVPDKLKMAVCIASQMASEGTDLYQVSQSNGAVTSEHIGQISFTYDTAQKVEDCTLYESINSLLRGLYIDKSNKQAISIQIRRAL